MLIFAAEHETTTTLILSTTCQLCVFHCVCVCVLQLEEYFTTVKNPELRVSLSYAVN